MKVKLIDYDKFARKPERAHYNDAGLDCFISEQVVSVAPGEVVKVKLGFGIELPDGYVAFLLPRSSLNAKGIRVEIGTIDSGYRGEIQAVVHNNTVSYIDLTKGMKIAQLVVMPVTYVDLVDELNNDRGSGGFGSTGK